MKERDVEVLQDVFDLYIRSKVDSDDETMNILCMNYGKESRILTI